MAAAEKIILITRKTTLEELVERHGTRAQVKFLTERQGLPFAEILAAHEAYGAALQALRAAVPRGVRLQVIDRGFLPTFLFGERDLAVTLGPDGLVVNAAKYLHGQPLLAFNPDPERMDGVLIPFLASEANRWLPQALDGSLAERAISMAEAKMDDGQSLLAVNDLFIGQRTHVSARYRISYRDASENQSSSGIIVSTGAGSTGWYRSVLAGAGGVAERFGKAKVKKLREDYRFDPTSRELRFSVREPFISRVSSAGIVAGVIGMGESLELASLMPHNGVIFSDGMESDFLGFDNGRIARIALAQRSVRLLSRPARA